MIEETLRLLTARKGGQVEGGGWARAPKVRFTARGRPAELSWSGELRPGVQTGIYYYVSVDMRGRSPGTLKIYPEGFLASIAKLFGAQDVKVGHRRFDALYVVKACPERLVHAVFRKERRDRAVAAVRRIGAYIGARIDLSRERLLVRIGDSMAVERDLENLWDTAVDMTEFVIDAAKRLPVLWDVEDRTPGATCQVCGTALSAGAVYCAACRTPHHRECWDYVGMCSTFACRERTCV